MFGLNSSPVVFLWKLFHFKLQHFREREPGTESVRVRPLLPFSHHHHHFIPSPSSSSSLPRTATAATVLASALLFWVGLSLSLPHCGLSSLFSPGFTCSQAIPSHPHQPPLTVFPRGKFLTNPLCQMGEWQGEHPRGLKTPLINCHYTTNCTYGGVILRESILPLLLQISFVQSIHGYNRLSRTWYL